VPAFKGLYGFPGSVCTSINNEIVHGIPSRKRVLVDGDIVSLDVGVKYEELYTDAAVTVGVGTIDATTQRLLEVTERSLYAGVAAATVDNHVGDIGAAIQAVVEPEGFAIVATSWATAWGTGRTRTRRCPTTASRSGASGCRPGSRSPSSRW
jgi:methionyl aminopeptidase